MLEKLFFYVVLYFFLECCNIYFLKDNGYKRREGIIGRGGYMVCLILFIKSRCGLRCI